MSESQNSANTEKVSPCRPVKIKEVGAVEDDLSEFKGSVKEVKEVLSGRVGKVERKVAQLN